MCFTLKYSFILFHGTGRSYTILHTAKTCSVAICSRSISWVVRFIYCSSWSSLWLPSRGSSCSSLVLTNQISYKLALVLCEAMALTHVSDTYKVIAESFESVMNCIFTSYSSWCPLQSCPLLSSCSCTGISASAASTAAAVCWNHIHGQWLVLNFRDIWLWGAFLSIHRAEITME